MTGTGNTWSTDRREFRRMERRAAKADAKRGGIHMVENHTPAGRVVDALIIGVLLIIMLVCIVPLWHVVMASFSDGKAIMIHEGVAWTPVKLFNTGGYELIFRDGNIWRGYLNTLIYVAGGTLLGLGMNIMAGYILSRETKLKAFMTMVFVFTTMFSGGTVPTYMVIRKLGMTGTMWSLIIPGATNAMFMLLMSQTFAAIDKSYEEAAKIDGANHWNIMTRVLLPQCTGMLIVTSINTAIMKWNAWFEASIYVPTQKDLWPLQLWVKQYTETAEDFLKSMNPDYNKYLIQFAVIVIATAPILIALPFFIGKLEKGMVIGGVKG